MQKQMFKAITPVERKDGTKFWMRIGSAFRNKDDSINVYLDAMPVRGTDFVIQIRELTEEDLRQSESRRASRMNPPTSSAGAPTAVPF